MATDIRAGKTQKSAPKYQTERDGRRFAIELLQTLERQVEKDNEAGLSGYSAQAEGEPAGQPPQISIYRTGAQSRTLARAFRRLYRQASTDALGGFWTVWTDWIGSSIDDVAPSSDQYVLDEMQERMPAWGSVVYAHPQLARAALAKGEKSYTLE